MKKSIKKALICIGAGVVCYLAMEITHSLKTGIETEKYLQRGSYGQGDTVCSLWVDGLCEEEVPVQVPLRERSYTAQEAREVFEQVWPMLEKQIAGEHVSLNEVRGDLDLPDRLDSYGLRVYWQSQNPDVIDSFGEVWNEGISDRGVRTILTAELTDGIHRAEHEFPVRILPPLLTEKEKAVQGFLRQVSELDERNKTQDGIWLPKEYEGRTLYYRNGEGTDYKVLLVLGVVLAVLCYAKDQSDERKSVKRKHQQMLLDYSEIISKLMVFLGAGMAVPLAWERIVKDYETGRKKKGGSVRYAYEEMRQTYYQVQSGAPDGKAYADFGRRCGLLPYLKLSSLLEQNRKNGTKNLRALLELEMAAAFEQRKTLARRMGEEAGTKLLAPLFLMLGLVMVMILVPAMITFY